MHNHRIKYLLLFQLTKKEILPLPFQTCLAPKKWQAVSYNHPQNCSNWLRGTAAGCRSQLLTTVPWWSKSNRPIPPMAVRLMSNLFSTSSRTSCILQIQALKMSLKYVFSSKNEPRNAYKCVIQSKLFRDSCCSSGELTLLWIFCRAHMNLPMPSWRTALWPDLTACWKHWRTL